MAARPRIAIAHDYLTQRGGAERVVLSMAKAFPDAAIYTTLYDPDATYPEFADLHVITTGLNRISALRRHHRLAFPFLAPTVSATPIDADLVVASSSGWAHGFNASGKKLVYCHAPARWLYQPEAYLGGSKFGSLTGLMLAATSPALRVWDRRMSRGADLYLCNSTIVRERIADAYSIRATVLPAPIAIDSTGAEEPVVGLLDWEDSYLLVVARLLPYKNVQQIIEAVRDTSHRLVVVGSGPLEATLAASAPSNVRFEANLSDERMRWVYSHCTYLIAASIEDYGLTPIEAGSFGKPTLALRAGGYLDTVSEGVSGLFFEEPTPVAIRATIERAAHTDWDTTLLRAHMEQFQEATFIRRLQGFAEELLGQSP